MDSFLNYTFLGKNIKENPKFSANYMDWILSTASRGGSDVKYTSSLNSVLK
jgi:hypothetical protein